MAGEEKGAARWVPEATRPGRTMLFPAGQWLTNLLPFNHLVNTVAVNLTLVTLLIRITD